MKTQISKSSSTRQVAAASVIGNTLEFYDFFIFGTAAAIVFPVLFFGGTDPIVATLISFATFGSGFLARPVGSVVFGHFGDRIGRKPVLYITLMLMGTATLVVGLLPTYDQIGIWAPIALTFLRLVQGFAVGGEWGGAMLMSIEHAPRNRRGLFAAIPNVGSPLGTLLATGAFFAVSQLDDEAFFSWGWRLPFIASIALMGVGLFIRARLSESPEFARTQASEHVARVPVAELIRHHGRELAAIIGAFIGFSIAVYVFMTFMVSYAGSVGIDRSTALLAIAIASAVAVVLYPVFGALADKVGPKRVYLFGLILMLVAVVPAFALVNTGSATAFVLAVVMMFGVAMAPIGGVVGVVFTQVFPPRVRYSGSSIGFTMASILGGAFAPFIATWLVGVTGSTISVVVYLIIGLLVSLVSMRFIPAASLSADDEIPSTGTKPREQPTSRAEA